MLACLLACATQGSTRERERGSKVLVTSFAVCVCVCALGEFFLCSSTVSLTIRGSPPPFSASFFLIQFAFFFFIIIIILFFFLFLPSALSYTLYLICTAARQYVCVCVCGIICPFCCCWWKQKSTAKVAGRDVLSFHLHYCSAWLGFYFCRFLVLLVLSFTA